MLNSTDQILSTDEEENIYYTNTVYFQSPV